MTKKTPLHDIHIQSEAKMAEFAGFDMPIVYSSIKEEHQAVRERVGLFDVSHMGTFILQGPEAEKWLNHITTNDVSKLEPGKAQYTCMPTASGGIVDDLLIYQLPDTETQPRYMAVVNASNIEKDWNWMMEHKHGCDATAENTSDSMALLALQGPKAAEVLNQITSKDVAQIPFYQFSIGSVGNIENVIISATGYTGSGGFELYVAAENAPALWQQLMEAGKKEEIAPCGLGARDDIDDTTSPLAAGLGWITKLKSKGTFVGRSIIERQKEEGLEQRLVGFAVQGRRVPRKDYPILDSEGAVIGRVTSGSLSPTLGIPIGMGYVEKPHHKQGTNIQIDLGKKQLQAEITKRPFVKV
ncbi:MAG: glycine cleavage system aminomethyltransferase GcvT [Bacteroidetes bacterium]|jgi:aminomethyltransferase|nr:glycine cleavage system aminomethyltransferase GcvT [Bacteroidota bacterium]